jgi:hypothetical protein
VFSVEVDRFLTVTATLGSTESGSAAMRTIIAFLLLLHPLFSTQLLPSGDASQDNLFADGNWEIVDQPAGEVIALMAALYIFIPATRFYMA